MSGRKIKKKMKTGKLATGKQGSGAGGGGVME
jgi:hypothetical protein